MNRQQTNGFDADSEGSDCELVPNMNNTNQGQSSNDGNSKLPNVIFIEKFNCFCIFLASDCNGNPCSTSNIETVQSTSSNIPDTCHVKSPTTPIKQNMTLKRPRKQDSTKFNRSNRESKNCGIFYFKHSDTEPETGSGNNNGNDSSQDASEIYSEDDQWFYSNGQDQNGNSSAEIEGNLGDLSMAVNYDESIFIDTVESPAAQREVCYHKSI